MKYNLTKPCDQCPFRSDKPFSLSTGRVSEFVYGPSFACHKTVNYEDESNTRDTESCAGIMILLEKENEPNQMMRIAERLGIYDRTKLEMDSPVYDSIDDAICAIEFE